MAASKPVLSACIELVAERRSQDATSKNEIDMLSEQAFAQMLRVERRRTERSGNPFMLVLVTGWDCQSEDCARLVDAMATAVVSCTRETDTLGWYKEYESIGLLLTEVGEADDRTVAIIMQKISDALLNAVGSEEFSRLKLRIRLYPQKKGEEIGGEMQDAIYPDLSKRAPGQRWDRILKRALDIVGSLLALILFLPIFVGIAVLIKLTSKGPVFFCQKRVGQYGRMFAFFKFRSMYHDNDSTIHQRYVAKLIDGADGLKQSNGAYKLVDDPRVTPLGRFLRRTSLDELPQFVNVLRGDMSLVGPRPPVPYEFDLYRPWHKRRVLEIQPGLTGLWQIKGRSRTTFDEMVRMDIRYTKTRSILRDLIIILQTPVAMFSGNGAF
jgi:lipopolysaccharide/colanic/teichoic acid biosynthesis glycosyltransferase